VLVTSVKCLTVSQDWYDLGISNPARYMSAKTAMKWVFTDSQTVQIIVEWKLMEIKSADLLELRHPMLLLVVSKLVDPTF